MSSPTPAMRRSIEIAVYEVPPACTGPSDALNALNPSARAPARCSLGVDPAPRHGGDHQQRYRDGGRQHAGCKQVAECPATSQHDPGAERQEQRRELGQRVRRHEQQQLPRCHVVGERDRRAALPSVHAWSTNEAAVTTATNAIASGPAARWMLRRHPV